VSLEDRYRPDTTRNALIVIDKTLSKPDSLVSGNVVALPILQTAAEVVGNPLTANIIAAGATNALLGIAPAPLMEQAVRMHIPRGTEQINLLALKEGRRIGSRISHFCA
jgi:2-oxoglutarate ferredoxin oxidoreductase subunit gamma